MRFLVVVAIVVALCSGTLPARANQAPCPKSQEAYAAEVKKLHWKKGPGNYDLGGSHARISLPSGIEIVTGADAERMAFLLNGLELPETVAIAQSRTSDAIVYIDYYDEGFVTDEDWSDIDPDAMLRDISDATEAANAERRRSGMAPMHTVGWLVPPSYDPDKKVARWAIELEENGEHFANIQVIKLGRHGYHQTTWAGPVRGVDGTPRFLQTMIDSHSCDEGYRYADYVEGDKLAGFGIGALVTATAIGSKPGKGLIAAIFGGGILLAKKAWFVIVGCSAPPVPFSGGCSTAAAAIPPDGGCVAARSAARLSPCASYSAKLVR